jgi:hypothetical protein
MRERGQATAEYAGIGLLVLALLLGAAAARGQLAQPAGDAAYLDQARQVAPLIVPERGDDEVPVDFRTCRSRSCATGGPPGCSSTPCTATASCISSTGSTRRIAGLNSPVVVW